MPRFLVTPLTSTELETMELIDVKLIKVNAVDSVAGSDLN